MWNGLVIIVRLPLMLLGFVAATLIVLPICVILGILQIVILPFILLGALANNDKNKLHEDWDNTIAWVTAAPYREMISGLFHWGFLIDE